MICTTETNFCRVFELPDFYPGWYCFARAKTVPFTMVDWFNPVPDSMQGKDWETEVIPSLLDFLRPKCYVKSGKTYLVLTDFGKSFTFAKN